MTQGPQTTGRVMVTIKAASKQAAIDYARKLKNFELDETADPVDMHNGTYVVFGRVTGSGEIE